MPPCSRSMSHRKRVTGLVLGMSLILGFAASATASVVPTSVSPAVQVDSRAPGQTLQNLKSPSVAVSPTDPRDMVMATRFDVPDFGCQIWYSRDAGATWAASAFPPAPQGECWAASTAFDDSGRVYVTAQDRTPLAPGGTHQDMIVWSSGDGGQSFGAPVLIPASMAYASPPPAPAGLQGQGWQGGIAVDNGPRSPHRGRVYVAWEFTRGPNTAPPGLAHDRTNLSYSDDHGLTWSPKVEETSFPAGNEEFPKPAIAPDGTVYVVYRATQDTQVAPSSGTCNGIGFTFPAGATPPYSCPVRVLRYSPAAPGAPFVSTFDDGSDVQAAPAQFPIDAAASESDGVAVAPDGTILVTYAASGSCSPLDVFVVRSSDRGATWSAPLRISDDPCNSGTYHRDPWISIAPNGRVDAIFNDNRNDPGRGALYDTFYANSTDGGRTFGPNTRVSDKSFNALSLFAPLAAGFQTNEYDTSDGIASTNAGAVGAWADTRNDTGGTGLSDVLSSRIGLIPVNVSPPLVSGSAVQGAALTVGRNGSWSGSPSGYAYQWQRCDRAGAHCVAIAGASGRTYVLTAADVSSTIRVQETASNASGAGVPATSSQTAPVRAPRPAITGYRITDGIFVVSAARTSIFGRAARNGAHRKGTAFRYGLSEAATARIVIAQRLPGRLHGRSCVVRARNPRSARRCTRISVRGMLTRTSHRGANMVAFSGRIGSRALAPGRYQATLLATDSTKHSSTPQTLRFTIAIR